MNLEINKIQNIATYLSDSITDLYFTKFLKLLYYIDFISVLESGKPVTGDVYYHLPYGPVPTFIKDQLSLLKKEYRDEVEGMMKDYNIVIENNNSIFSDYIKLEEKKDFGYVLRKNEGTEFNNNTISDYEKGLLDDIIKDLGGESTSNLVKKTHREVPYLQTISNDRIDYRLAFYLNRNSILPSRTYCYNIDLSQSEYFCER